MRKLLAPDGAIRETSVRDPNGVSRTYKARDGGIYRVSDSDAGPLLKEGFTESSASGGYTTARGRTCTDCGFVSFFTTCSRCGGACQKGTS